ncbi:MAG: L-threonine 3-dehydrogenase [Parcubacteria group bacterium CG08_land_8_20_14_0_20_38_56]|nr:MAG: L-threonine 3-dehydrogenase [Parcubacteria group bacterium CG08_land_8_20_14_0_20_38_56]
MKAVVKTQKAPGAELLEMPLPEIKPDEALIKIKVASICGTDVHIYNWDSAAQVYIKNVPQILGHEFAGEIVKTGKKVKKFRVGDYVSAETHFFCGKCAQCRNGQRHICETEKGKIFGLSCDGCFAEYAAVPERILWKNNPRLAPEIATLQEPLGNAVYCALGDYDKNLKGKKVLIFGDGPAGLLAAGVAKAEGARFVTLVGRHQKRLEIAGKIGADITLNEKENNATELLSQLLNIGKGFDVALEMAGSKNARNLAIKSVRDGGRLSLFGIDTDPFIIENSGQYVRSAKKIIPITGRLIWRTWRETKRLLESGLLDITPVITHKFPLEEFEKGFRAMTERPKVSGKVILIP